MVRNWAQELGMPGHVFALVDGEIKPVYVDFDSPALVGMPARLIRAAGTGTVRETEMLPDPDHTWLTDRARNRYTGELRLIAVDIAPA